MSSLSNRYLECKLLKNKELFLVNKIRERAERALGPTLDGVLAGIGDDAAVLAAPPPGEQLLATTDLVIEGVHFDRRRHPPRALGHKVLARGLSDIAAMGGRPRYALLSLCLPRWAGPEWQKQFWNGLFALARRRQVALVGGDTAAGARLAADIVVLGTVRKGRALRRGLAKTRDIIYVSGYLGGSALGLQRLRRGVPPSDPAVRRHLFPEPRLELGRFLAEDLGARAALDLSDGLSIDLYRLVKESGVGAQIRLADLPVYPAANLQLALHGGEDYELLFALDPRRRPPRFYQRLALTPIGVITPGSGVTLVGPGGDRVPLPIKGFQHAF